MEKENLNMDSIIEQRRHAVEESLQVVSNDELKKLEESLFPDVTHPWCEPFREFVEQNLGSLFFHAKANKDVHVLYCREKEVGIWYLQELGIGILQPDALEAMKQIVDSRSKR